MLPRSTLQFRRQSWMLRSMTSLLRKDLGFHPALRQKRNGELVLSILWRLEAHRILQELQKWITFAENGNPISAQRQAKKVKSLPRCLRLERAILYGCPLLF